MPRNRLFARVFALLFAFLPASSSLAEESPSVDEPGIAVGAETDLLNRYVWRGISLSDGAVQQSTVWAEAGGFAFSVWANTPLDGGSVSADEVDLAVTHSLEINGLTIEPTLQVYTYPGVEDAPSTTEISLRLSRPAGPLELFTTHSLDVDEANGAYYAEVGVALDRSLGLAGDLSASLTAGWGSSRFHEANNGLDRSAWSVMSLESSLQISLRDGFYLRPHAGVHLLPDRELRQVQDRTSYFVIGLAAGWEL